MGCDGVDRWNLLETKSTIPQKFAELMQKKPMVCQVNHIRFVDKQQDADRPSMDLRAIAERIQNLPKIAS